MQMGVGRSRFGAFYFCRDGALRFPLVAIACALSGARGRLLDWRRQVSAAKGLGATVDFVHVLLLCGIAFLAGGLFVIVVSK